MMNKKENISMFMAFFGVALAVGGWIYNFGVTDTNINTLKNEVSQLREDQSKVGSIQVEQAKQGADLENLKSNVKELKDDTRAVKDSVEQSRREQQRNFQELLDAVSNGGGS